MESYSTVKSEGGGVNWSHPMHNPTHLPPKSPAFSGLGSSLFESSVGGCNVQLNLPMRNGGYKFTQVEGYNPEMHPSWLGQILESSELESSELEVPSRKALHQHLSRDFVTSLATPRSIYDDIAHKDEFDARQETNTQAVGCSTTDFQRMIGDRLGEGEVKCTSADTEPIQRQLNLAVKLVTAARTTTPDNFWTSKIESNGADVKPRPKSSHNKVNFERGGIQLSTLSFSNTLSTVSDSNKLGEVSNEDLRGGRLSRYNSEPEVQGLDKSDRFLQQSHQRDMPYLSEEIDPSLDLRCSKWIHANRQSAQRSRVRKLQYISELEISVNAYQMEITAMLPQVVFYDCQRTVLNAENIALKQKLISLAQGQRLKDVHNEALKKEVKKLRYLCQRQPQQQHTHDLLHPLAAPSSIENLLTQQFSKLDLDASSQSMTSGYSSGMVKIPGGLPCSLHGKGGISPSHICNNSNAVWYHSCALKGLVP